VTPRELMLAVCGVLNESGARYFVTGSVASMMYGEVRSTMDVDIVADLRYKDALALRESFHEPDYYFEPDSMYHAMSACGMFNIIHVGSALKADIIVPKETAHNGVRLDRARETTIKGQRVMVSAPEDVILSKLAFYREGGSDKHLRDIASMFKISGDAIDLGYIESWVVKLGVTEQWAVMKAQLGLL